MPDDVGNLIVSQYETGLITRPSVSALLEVTDISLAIDRGLGYVPSNASSAFLVSILVDDSGSIFERANNPVVADGHNGIVDELQQLAAGSDTDVILLYTRYLNGSLINPYTLPMQATLISAENYRNGGNTPLYSAATVTLGTVLTKAAQLARLGITVRTFTLIISDGADTASRNATAGSVAWIVGDMLMTGSHIVAAMGVNGETDFHRVFGEMGIKPGWILNPENSRAKIREAFRQVSETLRLASGSSQDFAELALGPGPGFA
jgi:hypothetical protein